MVVAPAPCEGSKSSRSRGRSSVVEQPKKDSSGERASKESAKGKKAKKRTSVILIVDDDDEEEVTKPPEEVSTALSVERAVKSSLVTTESLLPLGCVGHGGGRGIAL